MTDSRKREEGILIPSWRPFTYVILAVQLLFAIWLISRSVGIDTTSHLFGFGDINNCPKDDEELCRTVKRIGTTSGVVFILVIWALIDVILGVSWVVTNDNLRTCPACGGLSKNGWLVCPDCAYEFCPTCGGRSKNGWLACPDCGYEFVAAAALKKSPTNKNCPECAESILAAAKVCRYCGHHFPTTNLRCFKCKHLQAVPAGQTKFTCEQCGQRLERKTAPPKRENAAQDKKESAS